MSGRYGSNRVGWNARGITARDIARRAEANVFEAMSEVIDGLGGVDAYQTWVASLTDQSIGGLNKAIFAKRDELRSADERQHS